MACARLSGLDTLSYITFSHRTNNHCFCAHDRCDKRRTFSGRDVSIAHILFDKTLRVHYIRDVVDHDKREVPDYFIYYIYGGQCTDNNTTSDLGHSSVWLYCTVAGLIILSD